MNWISVEDEMPDPGEKVLCYEPVTYFISFWIGINYYGEDEGWDSGTPSHWMRLPDSPEKT